MRRFLAGIYRILCISHLTFKLVEESLKTDSKPSSQWVSQQLAST